MNDGAALMRNVLTWGIPFAIVLAALGYETDWGRDVAHETQSPATAAPQPVAVALLPEYRIDGGIEARKETVERALFNPTRRAAPPASQTAGSKSAMQQGAYALTGTTVVGNVATAILREVKGGKSHTVHQGETLNGVVVAEVKADHVRLKQGDDVEDLQLRIAGGPKSTVQVAAPTPGAPTAQAAAQAVGGTGGGAPGASAIRPIAPPAGAAASEARPGVVSVGELLAERRRAARAAAEAAAPRGQPAQQAQP
ncbi:MAG TPA: hypothetical protein VKU81_00595 [Casimicrobiaceae bacterium]|nr:hypothetical protein [Casimicrobiaceae bacterium]